MTLKNKKKTKKRNILYKNIQENLKKTLSCYKQKCYNRFGNK